MYHHIGFTIIFFLRTMPEPVTPAPQAQNAPVNAATPEKETVSVSKTEYESLQRDAARASEAQARAARFENALKQSKGNFKPTHNATPPSQEEQEAAGVAEDRKAERGLMALAHELKYREILDGDPTLRSMLVKNPLAVLPTLLDDQPFDAEDAISMVKGVLDRRLDERTQAKKAQETPKQEVQKVTPPSGANGALETPDREYEEAKKNSHTEVGIARMISIKGRRMAGL